MRFATNLLITMILLMLLNAMNWLTLSSNGSRIDLDHFTWPAFGSLVLVAVILWLVGVVVRWVWKVCACCTLGLMFLAYPFIGWVILKLTAHFMPDTLGLHGFWITAICGFLLMITKIPAKKHDETVYYVSY